MIHQNRESTRTNSTGKRRAPPVITDYRDSRSEPTGVSPLGSSIVGNFDSEEAGRDGKTVRRERLGQDGGFCLKIHLGVEGLAVTKAQLYKRRHAVKGEQRAICLHESGECRPRNMMPASAAELDRGPGEERSPFWSRWRGAPWGASHNLLGDNPHEARTSLKILHCRIGSISEVPQ